MSLNSRRLHNIFIQLSVVIRTNSIAKVFKTFLGKILRVQSGNICETLDG